MQPGAIGALDSASDWSFLVDLAIEGKLDKQELGRLEERLDSDPALFAEHQTLGRLHEAMDKDKVEVPEGFTGRVMEGLPAASWEAAPASSWLMPLAAMLLFTLGASLLLGSSGLAESPIFGTGFALFDFLQTTTMAGAGLVVATWKGAGFGLEQLFAESGVNMVVLGAGILMLNLLLFHMLRRGKKEMALESSNSNSSKG